MKEFILKKSIEYIREMPQNVYALHFFINTHNNESCTPTLALLYNTLDSINETGIAPVENCWNIACWLTDEYPIIGNNMEDTEESFKTMSILSDWFSSNQIDYTQIEKDPIDDYFEYTVGYRVLSELVQEIAPDIKVALKEKFDRDVVLLLGEYSYLPVDIKRISDINGDEARPFIEYCENEEVESEDQDACSDDDDEFCKAMAQLLKELESKYDN